MRRTSKLPVGLLIAALVVAGAGVLSIDGEDAAPAAPPAPEVSELIEPASLPGMKTTEEIVAFWSERAADHAADYLSRTSLGHALMTQARETGDLTIYDRAEAAFDEALALNPKYPSALLGLGSARAAAHDFAAQRDLAQRVLDATPESPAALAAFGDASLELGDYTAAESTYHRLEAEERSAPVISRLGRLAHLQGRTGEAIGLAEEAVDQAVQADLPPATTVQLLFQLGHHRYEAGDVDGASDALDEAVALDPSHLGSLELLGQVRVAQDRVDDAIAIYEDLIARGPAADLHGSVAALYEATGDDAAAERHLAAGLELGRETIGSFPAERRHLAGFFGRHDPALALRLAREDLETRQDVHAHDVLAWALYGNRQYAEAAKASERALALGTEEVELLYHAGMIQAALGNDADARDLLRQALDLNPRFDVVDAPRAERTLERLTS